MKKIIYIAILVLAASSCKKDGKDQIQGPFSYNGKPYQTLAEAVSAIAPASAGTEEIILNEDASGQGVSLGKNKCLNVCLNLGSHTYTLEAGSSIDLADNGFTLKGNGGSIVTSSNAPAIVAEESEIDFYGKFSLRGENIIKSSSDISIDPGFTGELSGNVTLDSAGVHLESAGCIINIPTLKAKGAGAGLFADVDEKSSGCIVKIGEVISDQDYPVTSSVKGVISAGCNVHIHNFEFKTVPGNCTVPEQYQLVCRECGSVKVDESAHGPYGVCDTSKFIHFPGMKQTDYDFGNIEYWQCPLCGKCYSDKECLTDVSGNLFLFPNEYWTIHNILSASGEETLDGSLPIFTIVSTIASAIITSATSIIGIVLGKKTDWGKVNGMIAEIDQKVNELSQKINQLLIAVRNVENKINIINRQDDLASLRSFTTMTLTSINNLEKKYPKDSLRRVAEAKILINDWAGYEIGTKKESPVVLTTRLLSDYNLGGHPFSKTYADFINIFGVWEHDGYNYRNAMLLTDFISLGFSYSLSSLYIKEIKQYMSEEKRAADIKILNDLFDKYLADIQASTKEMHDRDSLYRILLPRNGEGKPIKFNRTLEGNYNFHAYITSHSNFKVQRKNKDNVAVNSCNRLMSEMGIKLDSILTATDAEYLNEVYNRSRQKIKPFTKMMLEDCGFKAPQSLTTERLDKSYFFPSEGGDFYECEGHVYYKIFHWECWKSKDKDAFGMKTMSSWYNHHSGYTKILSGANIVRKNGKFSKYGTKEDNDFYTARMTK